LKFYDNIELFIVGGKLNSKGFTVEFGLSNANFETANFQKSVVKSSNKKICIIPHTKLGNEGFVKAIDTKKFDIVITDCEALEEEIKKIEDLGVEVVVAIEN